MKLLRPRNLLAGSITSGIIYLYLNLQTPATSYTKYQEYLESNPLNALAMDITLVLTLGLFALAVITYLISKV